MGSKSNRKGAGRKEVRVSNCNKNILTLDKSGDITYPSAAHFRDEPRRKPAASHGTNGTPIVKMEGPNLRGEESKSASGRKSVKRDK